MFGRPNLHTSYASEAQMLPTWTQKTLMGIFIVILFLIRYQGRPGRYFIALGSLSGVAGFLISAHLALIWIMNWLDGAGSIEGKFPRLALGLFLMVVGVQIVPFVGRLEEALRVHGKARRLGVQVFPDHLVV